MKPEAKRFENRYGAAHEAIARLDIDQEAREAVARALTEAFTGERDFKPDVFWLLAADPLCACAGTIDGPCPHGREVRIAMHDSKAPDGRSLVWARRKPVVWCTSCGGERQAAPAEPRLRPTQGDLVITVSTLDWLLALVEEQDRDELEEPLRMARAFTESVRQHSSES